MLQNYRVREVEERKVARDKLCLRYISYCLSSSSHRRNETYIVFFFCFSLHFQDNATATIDSPIIYALDIRMEGRG